MKNLIFKGLTVATFLMLFTNCGQKQDAADYNNKMVNVINASSSDMTEMNNAMTSEDYSKAETVRASWESNLDKSIKEVETIGDFNGDASFKDEVLKALSAYKKVVTDDYKSLISMRVAAKSDSTMGEDKVQTLLDNINTTLENAGNSLNTAISNFEAKASK